MSAMDQSQQTFIQAKIFDFALIELVQRHRDSFQPLWTVDSWVKFLIWMTLNCGLSGEKQSMEFFVQALGLRLTSRMRKIFFERHVEGLDLHLMADPADPMVLIMPSSGSHLVTFDKAEQLLKVVGLFERVQIDKGLWQKLDDLVAIPWQTIDKED